MRRELDCLGPGSGVSIISHYMLTSDDIARSELNEVLPPLYNLLPLPAACSAVTEVLSESIFKYGKGTKVLTEPLISWATGPPGQSILGVTEEGQ